MSLSPLPTLERVLTRPETASSADLRAVRAAGLGGALRPRLPEDHPLRAELRADALRLGLRHAQVRAEVRALLEVWAAEGIPVLLFKGFALAEFEYASPGERIYGDVDVLLPEDPATVWRAAHLALAHGWYSDGQHADPVTWNHETMHLYSPDGHVRLDVHRYVVGLRAGVSPRRAAGLTSGLWARARHLDWEGVPLNLPGALDAAVLNVALGRSWGGDSGGLKPADYLDLGVLGARHGLTPADLATHAAALGAAHTWAAFTQLCDPWNRRLILSPTRTVPVIRAGLRADGVHARLGRWRERFGHLRRVWPLLPVSLLDALVARGATARGRDPRGHLRRWTPPGPVRRLPLRAVQDRIMVVGWWTWVLYPRQRRRGVCVPRAYASYRSLRRGGHPVRFVSGVAPGPGGVHGHAWIEDDRGAVEAYGEPENRRRFRELFSFPDPGDTGGPRQD
ncbi:lasso peptide biosynthesis B2 protein [uncultured Deinococcus sp.]|uniref:lasso peptide biosynthesis B2 protein n=1 Tax=uncultured Deinococcus sp. TaxID=158789 RepID=UPI00258F3307|nr:lasso peptide biosynthesis B2 protein [uncultured Deinococcus sp.]